MTDAVRKAKHLSEVLNLSGRLFNQIMAQAKAATNSRTSTLFGMAGGLLGCAVAYTLSFFMPGSINGLAMILAGIGVVGGVLVFRGSRGVKEDWLLEQRRRRQEAMLDEIRRLPKNTPSHVVLAAWDMFGREFGYGARDRDQDGTPPPALPG